VPYEVIFQKSDGGVITIYSGVVTDDDLLQSANDKCSSVEKIKSYRYALTDCSNVTELKVTTDAVIKNAEIAKSAFAINSNIIFVAAVPTDLMYGLSRLWQVYADESDRQTKVVRSREEADIWLAERL
jgi:hypothetical protein